MIGSCRREVCSDSVVELSRVLALDSDGRGLFSSFPFWLVVDVGIDVDYLDLSLYSPGILSLVQLFCLVVAYEVVVSYGFPFHSISSGFFESRNENKET